MILFINLNITITTNYLVDMLSTDNISREISLIK